MSERAPTTLSGLSGIAPSTPSMRSWGYQRILGMGDDTPSFSLSERAPTTVSDIRSFPSSAAESDNLIQVIRRRRARELYAREMSEFSDPRLALSPEARLFMMNRRLGATPSERAEIERWRDLRPDFYGNIEATPFPHRQPGTRDTSLRSMTSADPSVRSLSTASTIPALESTPLTARKRAEQDLDQIIRDTAPSPHGTGRSWDMSTGSSRPISSRNASSIPSTIDYSIIPPHV